MNEYNIIYRCVECGAEFTSPRISSEGYECYDCGSAHILFESELDGYEEEEYTDDIELFLDLNDIDYGDDDEHED